MKILVFGKTFNLARMHLFNMIEDINYGEIKKVSNSMNEAYVELKNGDTYQALNISENAKGYKCDKVYINMEVDSNIIERIIKPIICMSQLPEDEQIVYY